MLLKVLGAIDITGALILIFVSGNQIAHQGLISLFGLILISKSLIGFFQEFGGWIDLTAGILIIFSAFLNVPIIIKVILGILLFQKGFMSFL